MEAIKTTKLTKYYGSARGIEDLDLTVNRGEFFGFIGPNGAGKSTLIRTLLGLIGPTSGSGKILGYDIVEDKKKILENIGYMPSEAVFYSGMKVKEVLKFSAGLHGKDCSQEGKRLCERLHLDQNRKVEELSFGNRKKVAIVCALQHKPDLIILDEPTGGLDPLMQKEFFDILKERNEEGTTIFLSSHILTEIQKNCTRAAIIRNGRLIACDTVEALSETKAKRVTVSGQIDLNAFGYAKGIKDVKEDGTAVSFLYGGDIKVLLEGLSQCQLDDVTITEPDLEEIFLHYYEREGGAL